jgi:iron complex transport system permease protein
VERDIVWRLRLPRAAAAFACGALLAQAGALLQVLLRNPLADPYVLGISGGAAVGSLLAMLLGLGAAGTGVGALGGALAVVALVFALSFRVGDWNVYRLLLTGVVISAGCGALVSLLLTLAPAAGVKGMLFWLMGDLAYAGSSLGAWGVLGALVFLGLVFAGSLNVLSLGPLKARTLGVAVLPLQAGIYFAASLGTASAVLLGGSIGFVGLLAPHALRLLGVTDHRWLLPMAVLLGGGFLTLADTAARTLWAPLQLPVGVLTALLGVPLLLLLLPRGK